MELLKELAKDRVENLNFQGRTALQRKLKYFRDKIQSEHKILDVGQRNLLTALGWKKNIM